MKNSTKISSYLNYGINELRQDFITELACLIPNGTYAVVLLKVYPRLKRQSDGSEYYKIGSRLISRNKEIVEYIVPLQPSESLDQSVVKDYMKIVEENKTPTALCVSFLDIKLPLFDPHFDEIWLHTHYLLDGHHKMLAAARAKKPITMISFLSIDESFANRKQIEQLIKALSEEVR